MRRQRPARDATAPTGEPWGDYAVSTARWKGALLHDGAGAARPTADGVDVRFEGADHGAYHLNPILAGHQQDDLTFVRALPLALATDPAAEILIAYEMNGEPLRPDHGAPFRVIVPHWYAVASVKWLKRIDVLTEPYVGEFQTGHYIYEWPDRPHEPVSLMRVRARITDPARRRRPSTSGTHTVRGKAWSGTGPDHQRRGQPHRRGRVAPGAAPATHRARTTGRTGPSTWDAPTVGRHTLRARATDAAGNVQPEVPPWNRLGYGNNAIEVIYVDVR